MLAFKQISNAALPKPCIGAQQKLCLKSRTLLRGPKNLVTISQGSRDYNSNRFMLSKSLQRRSYRTSVLVQAAGNAKGQVYFPASEGQIAARIIKELLKQGFSVTAGVSDMEEAQVAVKLAKKLELVGSNLGNLKLTDVDVTDESSVASAVPGKNARVVIVVGDNYGGRRGDARAAEKLLAALLGEEAPQIQQLVLVNPLRAAGGTGFFGFGAPSKSASGKLSKVEQAVVDSGVNFVILRTGSTEGVDASYADVSNVYMRPLGNIPTGAIMAKEQVAAAVAEVMIQAEGNHIIEVAADEEAPQDALQDIVAQVLPESAIEYEDEEVAEVTIEEQEEAPTPKAGGLPGLPFGFGRPAKQQQQQQEEEEEGEQEAAPAPAPPSPRLPAWMSKRKATAEASVQEEEVEEETEKPARKPMFAFGKMGSPSQQQQQAPEEVPSGSSSSSSGGQRGKGLLALMGMGQKPVYVDEA